MEDKSIAHLYFLLKPPTWQPFLDYAELQFLKQNFT